MKHVIIGTAGHVDHGKTALIQALTGIDTTHLPEERTRGLTIELGFAHLDFPDGIQAGIVDVPGHEKFIRHMLCGAGGMDLAMLVVAADEGFMPQTAEHLEILTLLGLREGLVVLTKTDLTDDARIQAVTKELQERLRGTFLEGKPILPVSARTGEGIPALREQLHQLVLAAPERNAQAPFRLPVDRVFTREGFGTVVTGTLLEGTIRRETAVELVPGGLVSHVRSLQVHGQDVAFAQAGQRVAVNLAGIKKEQIRRGAVLAAPGSLTAGERLDVRLRVLPDARRTVRTASQVHLHHGASVQLARVVLLDRDTLAPGESGYAQLRLTEPLAARAGDRFVIRFLSPLETVGGGVILDPTAPRRKRFDPAALEALAVREQGDRTERVLQVLTENGLSPALRLAERLALSESDVIRELSLLTGQGRAMELLPGRYLAVSHLETLRTRCCRALTDYHDANPLQAGIRGAELRQKTLPRWDSDAAQAALSLLVREGTLRQAGDRYALPDFTIRLTRRQRAIRETMLSLCRGTGAHTPAQAALLAKFPIGDQADCRHVLESLLTSGELVRLSPQVLCHGEDFRRCRQTVEDWFADHETLTLAQFRDLLGTSRDYALLVLETLDRLGVTVREGNARRPGSAR